MADMGRQKEKKQMRKKQNVKKCKREEKLRFKAEWEDREKIKMTVIELCVK